MSDATAPPAIIPLGHARFLVDAGHERRLAYAIADGSDVWIWFDGRLHVVTDPSAPPPRQARGEDASLMAPMPATVRAVEVVAGATVSQGDVLVLLEAMKMELAIKAPRAGIVRTVHCKPGDLITPDDRLVELE